MVIAVSVHRRPAAVSGEAWPLQFRYSKAKSCYTTDGASFWAGSRCAASERKEEEGKRRTASSPAHGRPLRKSDCDGCKEIDTLAMEINCAGSVKHKVRWHV